MQKSTAIIISVALTIIIIGFYRLSFSSTPPTSPLEGIPTKDDVTSSSKPKKKQDKPFLPFGGSPSSPNKQSGDEDEDNNNESKNSPAKSSGKKDNSKDEGGETDGETDAPIDDGSKYRQSASTPSRAGCIDVSHEETTNQAELTARMNAFRPSATMWKQIWEGDTTVFTTAETEIPPIMKQWLYCFTHNYSGKESARENQDCTAELAENAPKPVRDGKYFISDGNLDKCTISPIYQGNVTSYDTLRPIHTQFPGPLKEEERSLKVISESRPWYWKNIEDPFPLSCPTCAETKDLVHPTFLLGARRWFSLASWTTYSRPLGQQQQQSTSADDEKIDDYDTGFSVENKIYLCMVIMQNSFRTVVPQGALFGTCSGLGQQSSGETAKWDIDFMFEDMVDISFAFETEKQELQGYLAFTVVNKERNMLETHVVQTLYSNQGTRAIWNSMQMLFGYDFEKNGKKVRGLFSPNEKKALFPRDITQQAIKLRCHPHILKILYMSPAVMEANKNYKNNKKRNLAVAAGATSTTLPRDPNYRLCWNDLLSIRLDPKSGKPISPWDAKKTKVDSILSSSSPSLSDIVYPPVTESFAYLPCHPSYTTDLVKIARQTHNMDSHGLYWPFSCTRIANRRPCLDQRLYKMLRLKGQERAPRAESEWKKIPSLSKIRMKDVVKPKVAVCMAGFVRSFHLARFAIFQNLVDPYDADFFAVSWNIQGRAKKTDQILKKHIIGIPRMRQRIKMMIPQDRNVSDLIASGRYGIKVLSYKMWEAGMKEWKSAGWRHAGLYMLLSESLAMAVRQAEATQSPYDVVIRGRFDLVPLVPIRILPVWNTPDIQRRVNLKIVDSDEMIADNAKKEKVPGWIIDTGSSCEMDGFWWPRTAILREGVIISHTADTRYKLFSWQYCDWLHIGTYNTMKRMADLYPWALYNYVDSGAQFVEHVWAIDQGVRFYPMQLYLKILRETIKKPKKNGKRVLKIRMHLFG